MTEKLNRRDQIIELIETGNYTKAEIAEELGIKVTGVSSNLTYLRWMGNFIIFGDDKKLKFTDEEGYVAWENEKKAGRKTASKSTRTPAEQFEALSKTISNQEKTLATWKNKVELMQADDYEADDETLLPEAEANVTLLEIKLGRNKAKLAEVNYTPGDEDEDEDVVEDEEDLI